ncbi:MAG: DUF389 domain-containing protein [Anaerolineae bacterium]
MEGKQDVAPETPLAEAREPGLVQLCLGLSVVGLAALGPLLTQGSLTTLPAALWGTLVFLPAALVYWQLSRGDLRARSSFQLVRGGAGEDPGFLTGWLLLAATLLLCALTAQVGAAYLLGAFAPFLPISVSLLALLLVGGAALWLLLEEAPARRWRTRFWAGGCAALLVSLLLLLPHVDPLHLQGVPWSAFATWSPLLPYLAVGVVAAEVLLSLPKPGASVLPLPVYLLPWGAGLGLAFAATVALGVGQGGSMDPLGQVALAAWGDVGRKVVAALAGEVLCCALVTLLECAWHQARALSEEGFLPRGLILPSLGPGARPGPLVVLLAAVAAALVAFLPAGLFLPLAAGTSLGVLGMVCWAAAAQPRRAARGKGVLPFHPLAPATGMAVSFFLFWVLPPAAVLGSAGWAGAGLLFYVLYARRAHAAAMEGVTVFRGRPSRRLGTGLRILVPLAPGEERSTAFSLAMALARQWKGEVLPLRVLTSDEETAEDQETLQKVARERSVLFGWAVDGEEAAGVPILPITRVSEDVAEGIVQTARAERCRLIVLGWKAASPDASLEVRGRVVEEVVRNAPCDVMVVEGSGKGPFRRILVPTAGGPHAPVAAHVGLTLAEDQDGEVTALYVCRANATPAEMALARERIAQTLAGLPHQERARPKLLCSDEGVLDAILTEAVRSHDIILVGASEDTPLETHLFGNLPEELARRYEGPVVIVKRYPGPVAQALSRTWNRVYRLFPTLSGAEQVEVYRALRLGARPNINYFVLIALSSIIATLGLVQGSAAVIIGAMLVAPLMTPILAISLGIVLGEVGILRSATESALKGVAASIGIAAFLDLLVPNVLPGAEILARTHPTMLDLAVALASGAAGAYAVARKEVAAALPGVAIAAALMPPLCTVGIGLASGWGAVASGALLLFVTNLVAINLAGSVVFLLLGFRPRLGERHRRLWFRRGLTVSVLLFLLIAAILGSLLAQSAPRARQEALIRQSLSAELAARGEARLVSLSWEARGPGLLVEGRIQGAQGAAEVDVAAIAQALSQRLGRPVTLRLVVEPVLQATSP